MGKSINFQRRHFEFIADEVAPMLGWPTEIDALADALEMTNDCFNREKFISRATQAWNDKHAAAIDEMADQELINV